MRSPTRERFYHGTLEQIVNVPVPHVVDRIVEEILEVAR